MISDPFQKWQIVILASLAVATPQFKVPFPMPGYPPLDPMMPPLPPLPPETQLQMLAAPSFPVPMSIPNTGLSKIPDKTASAFFQTNTPLNTTLEDSKKTHSINEAVLYDPYLPFPIPLHVAPPLAVPMPQPVPSAPVQFAVPGVIPSYFRKHQKYPNPPACPPCSCNPCTPSFWSYCSSCHQKCRCRNPKDAPIPLPPKAPLPLPGPAFPMPFPIPGLVNMVPFLPQMVLPPPPKKDPCDERRKESTSEELFSSSIETDISSLDSSPSKNRARKKKRKKGKKRRFDSRNPRDQMIKRPEIIQYFST